MTSPYRAAALARAHNDWVRERWLDGEPRLRGAMLCPAQDPLAAAAEIRRARRTTRFVHVLLPGGSERPYGEPRYLPIFEAAARMRPARRRCTPAARAWASPRPCGGAGPPSFYIEWHTLGSACSVMAHLVSLICHGIFDRLPDAARSA